ncbi:hypothetical protein MAC_01001 [Metarhizium acridum CQMa 102]|uniref:Uncharacterized protein n=1 Tax=Metarhizium acridum (strain CQMa 102) TaxID=655827 RepID=E9DTQ3_METAQ|nr:uncharacterized protein MAC_01001 [Metarhizium acridum CQMa 102]EFY92763.1 hypothetical protein MAC_01001 [Metarhizium acridum CQMa 102]
MESEPPSADEGRPSRRGRFMGKLFGKDKKSQDNSPATLDAFLHSAADHLEAQQNRPMAPGKMESKSPRISPRPNKKGMTVRFADSYPEIIGDGGDESDIPTIEIGRNKRARPPPPPVHRSPRLGPAVPPAGGPRGPPGGPVGFPGAVDDVFQPKPLRRTQTGYSSIHEPEKEERNTSLMPPGANDRGTGNTLVPGGTASARYLETSARRDDQRKSFIEIHQAQMREAEGKAFALAARTASSTSQNDREDVTRPSLSNVDDSPDSSRRYPSSPETHMKKPALDYSPAASISSNTSSAYQLSNPSQTSLPVRQPSATSQKGPLPGGSSPGPPLGHPPPIAARSASIRLQDAVASAGEDDALNAFVTGTKHLFELFRLHAEAIQPLLTCAPKDCARAAIWWFLKGRMGLESAVRERPTSPQSQMQNELDRQQAYSNLAKGYWLCREVIPEIMDGLGLAPDAEVTGASQSLVSALRKLSQSMKRNGFLPPEEPFLPQTIDKSIWLEYPSLSQDLNALLSGNWSSGLTAMQHPVPALQLLEAFPLGDTVEYFSYGRVMADVFLMEQGRESQRIFLPCILSMVRPQKSTGLVFIIASQNGCVQLAIQENKNVGPVWEDLRWQNDTCAVEVRMPRGFLLVVQLNQNDYRTLWNMYDFGSKVQSTLRPRSDELVVFRNNLRSFQYLDADPQSRVFPKEAVPQCDIALFEKIYKESGPAGPRSWHCGFRVAVVTGPRTRATSGVQHNFPPPLPVQFGFFRGEGDAPALSVRFVNGRQKGRMVFVFSDEKERVKFHSLLTGTALNHDERVMADAPLKSFMVAQSLREPTGIVPFSRMPWKAARVVNDEFSSNGDLPPTVLADKLKVILEYQNGTVADRVNVAPGELRMRLEVSNAHVLRVLRQPQQDITMSVSEAQVSKELPTNLADALQLLKANQTIRSYEFNNLKDLHEFQTAMTGFEIIFDSIATTFAISRRRMVVPIHKKWEAGFTRIQVVKLEDRQLQLLAFFEDFQYGHCMNFVLKGTDVYETFQRGSKAGLRFVDAKFPLPQLPADKDSDYDDMAFVCLDLPDLPGEHDDIFIMFENEADRDLLCKCLPATPKGSSRISSRLR